MALLIFEGFDNWAAFGTGSSTATNGDGIGKGWNGINGLNTVPVGTLGGRKIRLGGGGWVQHALASAVSGSDSIIVGTRYNTPTTLANGIVSFFDSPGTIQCGLNVNSSGKLIFWRGTSATVLGTGTTTIVLGTDNYIEVKTQFSNSANVEVRMNGVTEITLSGVDTTNTANQNCGFVQFVCVSSATDHDDVYICDSTGSAPHNDFLAGSGASFQGIRVETLFGTSNDSVQFTPNASTNVSRINESSMDSDTTYNSDATAGHIDTFNHGSLSSTPATIFAAKVTAFARKEDVSIKTLRTKQVSGATTSNGATYALTTLYQMYETIYTVDPNTGSAWTAANVNATKVGYEVVA